MPLKLIQNIKVAYELGHLLQSLRWSAARLYQYRKRKLREEIRYAFRYVPFYRERAVALGLSAEDILDEKDLCKLPLISREEVQTHQELFLSLVGNRSSWFRSRTSGSTGQPLVSYFDPQCWFVSKYALKMRRMLVCGARPGARIVQVETYSGEELRELERKQKTLWEGIFYRRKYLSVFEDPLEHLAVLEDFKPHFIYGFPSYFKALAEQIENGPGIPFRVQGLMSSGEFLSKGTQIYVEKVLGTKFLDIYGNTEFKEIAWQCPVGDGYHVNVENVVVELIDPNTGSLSSHSGEVVVSTLSNRAMPLIRYRTGDRARWKHGTCACGIAHPMLEKIEGRITEDLILPTIGRVSPYLFTMKIEEVSQVAKYQISLSKDQHLVVRVVLKKGASDQTITLIRETLVRLLQGHVPVEVLKVRRIERDTSGKFHVVEKESSR